PSAASRQGRDRGTSPAWHWHRRTARCTGRVVEAIPEAGATTAVAGLHHEADSDDAFVRPPWLERDQLDLSADCARQHPGLDHPGRRQEREFCDWRRAAENAPIRERRLKSKG